MKCKKPQFPRLVDGVMSYWYILVFVITSIYVICNFSECIDLHFTEEFNGKNLMFLYWLALIVLPLFDSIEGFGVSLKRRKQEEEVKGEEEKFKRSIAAVEAKADKNNNEGI